jgi:hypothetical protein
MTDEARSIAGAEFWTELRRLTAARIGLRRSGASLATAPLLEFRLAHARARDAVHEPLDEARLTSDLAGLGLPVVAVASAAQDRQQHLMRPDLGRVLAPESEPLLTPMPALSTRYSSLPTGCPRARCRRMRHPLWPRCCRFSAATTGGLRRLSWCASAALQSATRLRRSSRPIALLC